MGPLRVALRVVALTGITAPLYVCLVLCKPARLASARLGHRLHDFWVRTWARSCARVMGLRLETAGAPPEPPFFLVSNHLSYLDILVYHAHLRADFLSKAEVARWPLVGFLARTTGTLFIDRARRRDLTRVIEEVRQRLDEGRGVVVFPEGTSTKGEVVAPFKPSLFEVAVRTGVPVSTAALSYATPAGCEPAHMAVCWWGDMGFTGHFLRLLALPSIEARVRFGEAAISAPDRKALAARAQHAVAERFVPVVGGGA